MTKHLAKWVNHVKKWAQDHDLKYGQALKNADCRQAYKILLHWEIWTPMMCGCLDSSLSSISTTLYGKKLQQGGCSCTISMTI